MKFDPMHFIKNGDQGDYDFAAAEQHLADFTEKVMADVPEVTAKSSMFSRHLVKKAKKTQHSTSSCGMSQRPTHLKSEESSIPDLDSSQIKRELK